jgi:hypothetical protein
MQTRIRQKFVLTGMLLVLLQTASAQQSPAKSKPGSGIPDVDSIAFHLYTDSLKKEVYNYINVDGWLKSGRWIPLTAGEISFRADAGRFEGNNLFIGSDFTGEKVTITATYSRNPKLHCTTTIYLKKITTPEQLKTMEEVLGGQQPTDRRGRKRKGNL